MRPRLSLPEAVAPGRWRKARNGCHNFTATKPDRNGYCLTKSNGRAWLAHRAAWTVHRGPIQDGMDVCHRCDNPRCINPEHLFLGTHTENMADAARKGRMARRRGEDHSMAKLSEKDVVAIRAMRKVGKNFAVQGIAKQFGVSTSAIRRVWRKATWSHL